MRGTLTWKKEVIFSELIMNLKKSSRMVTILFLCQASEQRGRKVRQYFAEADIPYRDYDIEEDERANRRYEQLGVVGVPALRIGDRTIQGYDRAAIRAALDELGAKPES